ncbi:MAG TPA: hypothetical protein VMY79_02835 [Dehalococcoidia bacterium]|nr:hypothetical protein [Dehalococcoidia bacterium]
MRSIWKGSVNFGMAAIPAKLYPSSGNKKVSQDLVEEDDFASLPLKKIKTIEVMEFKREVKNGNL